MAVGRLVYADSSALVKLVRREAESDALRAFLRGAPELVTAEVAVVEVTLAAQRSIPDARAAARKANDVLSRVDLVRLDAAVVEEACRPRSAPLRALDAIHLASGLSLGDLVEAFVCYDAQLTAAAVEAGLDVHAPV